MRVVPPTVVMFDVSRRLVGRDGDSKQQEGQQQQNCHRKQPPSHLVTLERMFLLILLFLFGGVAADAPPFLEGVVTDECNTISGSCTPPPFELPGPSIMGGLFQNPMTAISGSWMVPTPAETRPSRVNTFDPAVTVTKSNPPK